MSGFDIAPTRTEERKKSNRDAHFIPFQNVVENTENFREFRTANKTV